MAEALTARDPVAAHTDAELRLDVLGATSGAVRAALVAGVSFAVGALVPLAAIALLPSGERVPLTFVIVIATLALTGWFAAVLTDLPRLRLIRRNVVLGAATMAISVAIGAAVQL